MVRNTRKPLVVTAWGLDGLRNLHRMMELVAGDKASLVDRPFVVAFLMAISPLRFPAESLQKLMFCAEHGIPCIWTSGCPAAGATSPIFPAGSLVVALAEFLAGLVLAQLTRPVAPVIVGSAFGALDAENFGNPSTRAAAAGGVEGDGCTTGCSSQIAWCLLMGCK